MNGWSCLLASAMHHQYTNDITAALHQWIGHICHVYLDNIIIWSNTVNDHIANVDTVLLALKQNKMYCNPKKMKLFCTEIWFLGHRTSKHGIEADEEKAEHITDYPHDQQTGTQFLWPRLLPRHVPPEVS